MVSIDFADPGLWIIGGIALIILTIAMIYFKVFMGETRGRQIESGFGG